MFLMLRRSAWLLLAVVLCSYPVFAQATLQDQLRATLIGQTFPLKSACTANRLTFNTQGVLTNDSPRGAWMVYSLFHPENVKLTDRTLEITGKREVDVVVATDSKSETGFPEADPTILTFQLAGPLPDLAAANAIVAVAFDSNKDRAGALGTYGSFLTPKPRPPLGQSDGRPARDPVQMPKVIFSPDPEYSTEARKAKVTGAVILAVVVDEQGRPEILQVVRRLGYGLDEEALIAVSSWKFEPARQDGNAVAYRVAIEATFNLRR